VILQAASPDWVERRQAALVTLNIAAAMQAHHSLRMGALLILPEAVAVLLAQMAMAQTAVLRPLPLITFMVGREAAALIMAEQQPNPPALLEPMAVLIDLAPVQELGLQAAHLVAQALTEAAEAAQAMALEQEGRAA